MNRLRKLREKQNKTLKQLSDDLGKQGFKISSDALGKYERGAREPKLETWQKLAKFFDVPVPYLQGFDIDDYLDKVKTNSLSTLGLFFYENESKGLESKELNLHEEMTDSILYGQKDSALKSITNYIEFLSKLKARINIFSDNKFMDDYFCRIVDESWDDSKSNLASVNRKLIKEITERVENGNKKLRDFIVKKYILDSFNICESYLKYKKNHNENSVEVENYLKKENERFKKENPKLFKLMKSIDEMEIIEKKQ